MPENEIPGVPSAKEIAKAQEAGPVAIPLLDLTKVEMEFSNSKRSKSTLSVRKMVYPEDGLDVEKGKLHEEHYGYSLERSLDSSSKNLSYRSI